MKRFLLVITLMFSALAAAYVLFPVPVEGQNPTSFTAGVGTPALDGTETPGEWTGDSITTSRGVTIKAMMDSENFYILAHWPDETMSVSLDHWTWDGQQWSASEDEDRIAFIWEIVDAQGNSLNGENGPSCGTMCHPGEGMATTDGRVDVWHGKSTRFLPIGATDDKYWDTDGPNGRHDDSGTGSGDRNRNEEQTGPVYGPPNVTFLTDDEDTLQSFNAYGSALGTAAVKVALDGSEQFAQGDTIPGRILKNPTGNRASVKSVGRWVEGTWVVEFSRKRAGEVGPGGLAEDFAVVPGGSVRFTTEIFDNLSEHANHSFSFAGTSGGADFTVYTLHFPDPAVFYLSQIGGGGGFSSDAVFTNPSVDTTVSATMDLFDSNGDPLLVDIASVGEGRYFLYSNGPRLAAMSSVDIDVPPLSAVTVSTSPGGELLVGAAEVNSDFPLGSVVRFSIPGIGIAGVGASQPVTGFISPARRVEGGINTGVALHNTSSVAVDVTLSLRTAAEGEVGSASIEGFPARGHLARFISELFLETDTSNFEGSIVVEVSGGTVAATVLELGNQPGQFTTLPVTPLR